jgi:hypothetical protein
MGAARKVEAPSHPKPDGLTLKQRRFLDAWLSPECQGNGVKAALKAGYLGSYRNLGVQAAYTLRSPRVQAEILRRTGRKGVDEPILVAHLCSIAAIDPADFKRLEACEDRKQISEELGRLQKRGLSHLVKRIHWTARGPSIEYHDRANAIHRLGQLLGLWLDKVEYTPPKDLSLLSTEELRAIRNGNIPAHLLSRN